MKSVPIRDAFFLNTLLLCEMQFDKVNPFAWFLLYITSF